jgi:hypothetical protein
MAKMASMSIHGWGRHPVETDRHIDTSRAGILQHLWRICLSAGRTILDSLRRILVKKRWRHVSSNRNWCTIFRLRWNCRIRWWKKLNGRHLGCKSCTGTSVLNLAKIRIRFGTQQVIRNIHTRKRRTGEQPMLGHNHGEGGKSIMSISQGFPVTFDMSSRKRSRKKAGNM